MDVRRDRQRPAWRTVVAAAALLTLTGCGDDPEFGLTEVTPSVIPTELTCPAGGSVGTAGGLLAEMPDGYDTRAEALSVWLRSFPEWGTRYALDPDGTTAWLLREDDTAVASVTFLEHDGYTADGYEACAPEVPE